MKRFGAKSHYKPSKIRDVPPQQPFIQLSVKLLESTALRSLDRYGHLMLSRLQVEHCRHAGKENGWLAVTYNQFVEWGVPRRAIKPTINHLVRVGLLVVERRGRGHAGDGEPSLYRLTYLKSKFVPVAGSPYYLEPTNDWEKFETKTKASKPRRDKLRSVPPLEPRKNSFLGAINGTQPVPPLEPSAGAKPQNSVKPLGSNGGTALIHYGVLGAKVLPLRTPNGQRNNRCDRPARSR
jgi:hypothetical protein